MRKEIEDTNRDIVEEEADDTAEIIAQPEGLEVSQIADELAAKKGDILKSSKIEQFTENPRFQPGVLGKETTNLVEQVVGDLKKGKIKLYNHSERKLNRALELSTRPDYQEKIEESAEALSKVIRRKDTLAISDDLSGALLRISSSDSHSESYNKELIDKITEQFQGLDTIIADLVQIVAEGGFDNLFVDDFRIDTGVTKKIRSILKKMISGHSELTTGIKGDSDEKSLIQISSQFEDVYKLYGNVSANLNPFGPPQIKEFSTSLPDSLREFIKSIELTKNKLHSTPGYDETLAFLGAANKAIKEIARYESPTDEAQKEIADEELLNKIYFATAFFLYHSQNAIGSQIIGFYEDEDGYEIFHPLRRLEHIIKTITSLVVVSQEAKKLVRLLNYSPSNDKK
ncbi:hypothetical protein ACFL21_04765 [Patescibacteria group bacterium]